MTIVEGVSPVHCVPVKDLKIAYEQSWDLWGGCGSRWLLLLLLRVVMRLYGAIRDPVPKRLTTEALVSRPPSDKQLLVVSTVTDGEIQKIRVLLRCECQYLNLWGSHCGNCRRVDRATKRGS